jgi:hypothetical protein
METATSGANTDAMKRAGRHLDGEWTWGRVDHWIECLLRPEGDEQSGSSSMAAVMMSFREAEHARAILDLTSRTLPGQL